MSGKSTVDDWKSGLNHLVKWRGKPRPKESQERAWRIVDAFLEFTGPKGSVLDIGCGRGDFGRRAGFDGYVGIDPIPCKTTEFRFVQGVGEHLPFGGSTFDCVTTMATLDHCLSPGDVVEECRRVLKDSGRLFIHLQVTRSDVRFKTGRLLHYLRNLDFRSLFSSLRQNVGAIGPSKGESCAEYGHVHSFTERSLLGLVSRSLTVEKSKCIDQDMFIVAGKNR